MNQTEAARRPESEIIPPELAVRAMRDSGYRNTAYALAELIDNSVQAKAGSVDVICLQKHELVNQRERRHLIDQMKSRDCHERPNGRARQRKLVTRWRGVRRHRDGYWLDRRSSPAEFASCYRTGHG